MIDLTKTPEEIVEDLILDFIHPNDETEAEYIWSVKCARKAIMLMLCVCEKCPYVYDPAPNPTHAKLSECLAMVNRKLT